MMPSRTTSGLPRTIREIASAIRPPTSATWSMSAAAPATALAMVAPGLLGTSRSTRCVTVSSEPPTKPDTSLCLARRPREIVEATD